MRSQPQLSSTMPTVLSFCHSLSCCSSHAGVTSYGSQFCMTCALRYARAAPALAMSYISVVLTIIYGYFIFHEVSVHPSLLPPHASLCFSM